MTSNNQSGRWRPQLSTIVAGAALFAALGGSAYAAKLIDGGKIRKGTVTSKQVKDKTIKKKDLNGKTVAALRGAQGPQGAQGPLGPKGDQGAKGDTGVQGPAGLVAPLSASDASENLTDGDDILVLTMNVPSGQYVVNAKTNMFAGAGVTEVACRLLDGAGTNEVDRLQWNPDSANTRTPGSLQAVTSATTTLVRIRCTSTGGTGAASDTKITAIPVS